MKFNILLVVFAFLNLSLYSQNEVSGIVLSEVTTPINQVEIYSKNGDFFAKTDPKGQFNFTTDKQEIELIFYAENFKVKNVLLSSSDYKNATIILNSFGSSEIL